MLLKAEEDFDIELSNSWMVDDGENDIKAGIAVGCKTVLISGACKFFGQTVTVNSLLDFVKQYLK